MLWSLSYLYLLEWAMLNGITDNQLNTVITFTSFRKVHFVKLTSFNGKVSSDNVIISLLLSEIPISSSTVINKFQEKLIKLLTNLEHLVSNIFNYDVTSQLKCIHPKLSIFFLGSWLLACTYPDFNPLLNFF